MIIHYHVLYTIMVGIIKSYYNNILKLSMYSFAYFIPLHSSEDLKYSIKSCYGLNHLRHVLTL